MRFGLSQMLLASIVFHCGLATVLFVVWHQSVHASSPTPDAAPSASLVLLRAEAILAPPAPIRTAVVPPPSNQPGVPVLPKAVARKSTATSAAPSLALEANPNAHVRAIPFESVLAPTPPPHLDSASGIVFLLDISGSMYEPCEGSTRLEMARQALSQDLRSLPNGTPFAIVLYAQTVHASGPLVAANDATREAAVRFIMGDVDCGGGTNLAGGFTAAQDLHPGRIVLASDGDLNVNKLRLLASANDILGAKGKGPALSIMAIEPRPKTEATEVLRSLAEQQGGTYTQMAVTGMAELLTSAKVSTP